MIRELKGQRFLVTGGAGFIGSHLVDKLLACGGNVTVLDNFSTGRRENLTEAAQNARFTLIEGDIREPDICRMAVAGCDAVFHEAALGSVPFSIADPAAATSVNIAGFVNMLSAAKENPGTRFIYASSSSVYGDNPELPKVEDRTGTPLSPYAITKFVDELYAANFHALYGIDTVGLRYFNVFGPRQNPASSYAAVIPKFISALLRHTSPEIYGDGETSRDFTYVENVVNANLQALRAPGGESVNQVYNISNAKRTTLNELFSILRNELARHDAAVGNIEPIHAAPRTGDIRHSFADISKAKHLLDYTPEHSFTDGIRQTVQWYIQNQTEIIRQN